MTWRADYWRERRRKLLQAGQCVTCAKPHKATTQRCLDCRRKYAARANARLRAAREVQCA